MKEREQLEALAELDGWEHVSYRDLGYTEADPRLDVAQFWRRKGTKEAFSELPNYLHSYDAIIPLIQKQDSIVQTNLYRSLDELFFWEYNATQLCEALLRATGKWKDGPA